MLMIVGGGLPVSCALTFPGRFPSVWWPLERECSKTGRDQH